MKKKSATFAVKLRDESYLVVKASVLIEVFKVRQIGLAPPEVHIGYLKVVVNWLLCRGAISGCSRNLGGPRGRRTYRYRG